jgi:hypothetical protein
MLILKTRHKINNLKDQVEQITAAHNQLSDQAEGYRVMISRYGDSLKVVNQTILSQEQALEMGLLNQKKLRDMYLKEVNNVVKLSEQVSILKKQGKWVDTVYIDTFENNEWLRIPAVMEFGDPWYKANITADNIPVLNSLNVFSEPTITIGTVKHGLFKKPEKVTIYENANPYIKLKSIESLTIKEQQKWYQTTWFKVGTGFILGGLTVGIIQ